MKQIEREKTIKILGDYGFGLCMVSFALLVTLPLDPWIAPHTTTLFLAAVAVTAWQKGLYPALLATFVSLMFTDYFFVAPVNSFELSMNNIVSAFVFSMGAFLISWVQEDRRRALHAQPLAGARTGSSDESRKSDQG